MQIAYQFLILIRIGLFKIGNRNHSLTIPKLEGLSRECRSMFPKSFLSALHAGIARLTETI
jgi:hypothetical protein